MTLYLQSTRALYDLIVTLLFFLSSVTGGGGARASDARALRTIAIR